MNTTITLPWVHKQVATPAHTLVSVNFHKPSTIPAVNLPCKITLTSNNLVTTVAYISLMFLRLQTYPLLDLCHWWILCILILAWLWWFLKLAHLEPRVFMDACFVFTCDIRGYPRVFKYVKPLINILFARFFMGFRSYQCYLRWRVSVYRADSAFAPNQWETALLCNDVSHWLDASLESTLSRYIFRQY